MYKIYDPISDKGIDIMIAGSNPMISYDRGCFCDGCKRQYLINLVELKSTYLLIKDFFHLELYEDYI